MKKKINKLLVNSLLVVSAFVFPLSCSNSNSSTQSSNVTSVDVTIESKNNVYSNPTYPLVGGTKAKTYTADPYVIRGDDGLFYMYCTQTEVYTGKSVSEGRTFIPGPIFVSNNCVDWTYKGNVFSSYSPTWGTQGAGVWAPTVCKVGNQYNYYYALSTGGDKNPGIGVATSPTPYGPWTHQGKMFLSDEIGVTNSIDPDVFIDDGKVYMAFGSYGGLITLVELTSDGLSLLNGVDYQKEHKVSLAGYEIFDVNNYEATLIIKKNGYYYLFLSTGTCCSGSTSSYHVVVGKSKSLQGPYLDNQGRDLFKPNKGEAVVTPSRTGVMGVGHCGIIEDDIGALWMIYHGYDTTDENFKDNRVLYMDKLIFDENGYPHVENYQASNHEQKNGPYINELEK